MGMCYQLVTSGEIPCKTYVEFVLPKPVAARKLALGARAFSVRCFGRADGITLFKEVASLLPRNSRGGSAYISFPLSTGCEYSISLGLNKYQ